MKIEKMNICVIDVSESNDASVSIDFKTFEELLQRFEQKLNLMVEKGIIEIEELNISVVDANGSKGLEVKRT